MANVGIDITVSLDSMSAALRSVTEHGCFVMLHRGASESAFSELPLGPIVSTDEEVTKLRHLTAWGEWEQESWSIETAKIACFEFGSPYLRALKRYASDMMRAGEG